MAEDCTVTSRFVEVFGQQNRSYSRSDWATCLRMMIVERHRCCRARAQRRRKGKPVDAIKMRYAYWPCK